MKLDETKTIGILGGYGPFATNDFFKLLLNNTTAKKDWDYPHVIIDSNPRIPSRARAFLFNEEDPTEYMLQAIKRLKSSGADFFVCPCNTAHYFLRKQSKLVLPFLDMIDITIQKIKEKGIKKIGILGSEVTVLTKIYETPLLEEGIEVYNVENLEDVRSIIEAAKQNTHLESAKMLMKNLISAFIEKEVEAVIYACTELPIVLPVDECLIQVIDSSSILAIETLKKANIKFIK